MPVKQVYLELFVHFSPAFASPSPSSVAVLVYDFVAPFLNSPRRTVGSYVPFLSVCSNFPSCSFAYFLFVLSSSLRMHS